MSRYQAHTQSQVNCHYLLCVMDIAMVVNGCLTGKSPERTTHMTDTEEHESAPSSSC